MKVTHAIAAFERLRDQPMWKLLRAHRASGILATLQAVFTDTDKQLKGSVLVERVERALADAAAVGEDFGQSAAAAVQDWLDKGWLTRSLPPGATEELYEPTVDAHKALNFVSGALTSRPATTQSHLSTVIDSLTKLAIETDEDPQSRLKALYADRARIDQAIEEIGRHGVTVLPNDRALELARHAIRMAEELTNDFKAVRAEFDSLNRGLRQSLVESDGNRAHVLQELFDGVDLIADSEAGKAFSAFWRLLVDLEQTEALHDALESIQKRPFARQLNHHERRFLGNLTTILVDEGGSVHEVMRGLASGLKQFVQSREFLEQRRLHGLLRDATLSALAIKDIVRPRSMEFPLDLTSSAISSISRHTLYDPDQRAPLSGMETNPDSDLTLADVARHIREAGIDMKALKRNILVALEGRSQVSIGEVLAAFPADQGLGTLYGYIDLAVRHGQQTPAHETVSWTTNKGLVRLARVPALYFIQERADELRA